MEQEPDKTAQTMVDRLKESKALNSQFTKYFHETYLIYGMSTDDWKEHFKVNVPPDLNPKTATELSMKLMELYQDACSYKNDAEMRYVAQKGSVQALYRQRFNELVAEYKTSNQKLPAEKTLATMAEAKIRQEKDAMIHTEIEVNFWKGILGSLQECRKLIENATWNLSVEAKALFNEKQLDNLNRNDT